ncbi:MAG TPA: Uma2 family endonuclease [Tepidisphaeraceae bacterium]|nr:Uma2 family endonuclease [Tepidisphaeraceae bacterium]
MGLPAANPARTIQDYYRIENDATEKHEFRDGEILGMSGGSPRHALIATNVAVALRTRLKGTPCLPYTSDLRVRIMGLQRSVYPDVSVVCGKIQLDPDDKAGHTILNPRLVVEVLSPSTEAYDRGGKFAAYREVPSLAEYVLISSFEPRVEAFLRQTDGTWAFSSCSGNDSHAMLRSLQIDLPLAEIYADIDFPPPAHEVA